MYIQMQFGVKICTSREPNEPRIKYVCTLAPPGEYSGMIHATAAMRAVKNEKRALTLGVLEFQVYLTKVILWICGRNSSALQ